MLAEGIISVNYGEAGVAPRKPGMASQSIPHCLRKEEVVVLNFTVERCRWDVKDSVSSHVIVLVAIKLDIRVLPS